MPSGNRSIFPELRPSRVDLPRDPAVQELQRRLGELQLSNEAIWQREKSRIASTRELLEKQTRQGLIQASILLQSQTPWYVMLPYRFLCWGLGKCALLLERGTGIMEHGKGV